MPFSSEALFWVKRFIKLVFAFSDWLKMDEKTIVKEEVLEEKDFVVELSGLIDSKLLSTGLDQANFLVTNQFF